MIDNHLPHAAMTGDSQAVKLFIEKGYDINSQDPDYYHMTALHIAVKINNAEMIKLLLEHNADVSIEDSRGYDSLYFLNINDSNDPLTTDSLNDSNETRETELEIVKMIVEQNVPLNTSSYYKALRFGSKEMVKVILQSNIDLFGKGADGGTPIHYLAGNANDEVIDELHGKKFDANELDFSKRSPLYIAIFAGLPCTVEFLLKNGANPNLQNGNSIPLSDASFSALCSSDVTKYCEIIELLIKYGADPQLEIKDVYAQPTVFSGIFKVALDGNRCVLLEPVIAHLALIEKQGTTIDNHIVGLINHHATMSEFLEICRQQLTILETIKINHSLSLYQLLISSDLEIEHYARNSHIMLEILLFKCENDESYWPYGIKIRKRCEQAVEMNNLRKVAVLAFCQLTQLNYEACCLFVDKIIRYLSRIDLQHLCEVPFE